MKTSGIIAALAVAAAAVPMNKRAIHYITTTTEVIEYITSTTTVWVDSVPTPSAQSSGGEFYNVPEVPAAVDSATPSAPAPVAPVSSAPPPPPPPAATSAVYQAQAEAPAPAPATSAAPAPAAAAAPPAPAAPAPEPANTYVAPAQAAAAPAPAAPTVAAASQNAPSGANVHSGDITYYDVGMGSCGQTSTPDQPVVALAIGTMNNPANPNLNPLCGKTITISYQGQTHQATVLDTCHDCSLDSIDLSTSLFKAVAPNGDGRVHGVQWWFN